MAERVLKTVLVADTRQLDRALGRTGKKFELFGRQSKALEGARGALVGGFGGKSSLLFGSASFLGGSFLAAGLKTSIDVASNLNEQINKTRVVFGRSADSIFRWSKTSATAFGLARDQALEAVSTFGNILVPLGVLPRRAAELSKSLVQLSGDLASFNNASPQQVLDDLRSGIVGESEPLRKYGILLSESRVQQEAMKESGKQTATELTNQEKVLARYTLILRDSAKAQGDFARTSDGLANKQRIAAARMRDLEASAGEAGAALESLALGPINNLLRGLTDAVDGVNSLIGALKRLGGISLPGLGSVGDIFKGGASFVGQKLATAAPVLGPIKTAADLIDLAHSFGGGKGSRSAARDTLRLFDPRKLPLSAAGLAAAQAQLFLQRGRVTIPGLAPGAGALFGVQPRNQPFTVEQRNRFFDDAIARRIDRVQDILKSGGQIGALQGIKSDVLARLAGTKDRTRRLTLEDEVRSIDRQIRATKDAASQEKKLAKERADAARKTREATLKEQAQKFLSAARDKLEALQSRREANRAIQDAREQLHTARLIGGPQGIKFAQRDLQDALFQRQVALLDTAQARAAGKGTFTVTIGTVNLHGIQNPKQLLEALQKLSRTGVSQSRGSRPGRPFGPF